MAAKTVVKDLSSTAGAKWEFKLERGQWKEIDVPAGGWRAQGYTCDAGMYRAWIRVPRSAEGKTVRIAFAAVNFGAEVFVGPDEDALERVATHVNGWMPFVADITHKALPGSKLLLIVRVNGRGMYLRDGKYIVPQGATWQPKLADGIIRGIEMQILPPVSIDDVFVRTSVDGDHIQPEVVLCNTTAETVRAVIKGKLSSWNGDRFKYPALPEIPCTLAAGERRPVDLGQTGWGLGTESYWFPNVPYRKGYRARLHNLSLTVTVDGEVMHEVTERFGFRQFEAKGCHYYLNGIRCNLRGDNQQEADFGTDAYGTFPGFGPPSRGNPGWPRAVDNLLRANFNVMRIHQVPPTPYMLDACDELGLMIVDETPIRGSEGLEDFVAGREHMIDAARELALRDRRHPCVVIWSAANEIWNQRGLALALQAAILAVDDTRPIIVDGVPDLGPELINMEHYVDGCGNPPVTGGTPRTDRPYGETESVWPSDNSWQGFAWMATCTRIRRLKGNADIRNYVLNNAWSNYVPGQGPRIQDLEKKIKDIRWPQAVSDMKINPPLTDMWNHPLIRLMQQCFHPVAVCDREFDELNYRSDGRGRWPTVVPQLKPGAAVTRSIAVFNDEFVDHSVTVKWELRIGSPTGKVHDSGSFMLHIPLGEFRVRKVGFVAPNRQCALFFVLRVFKGRVLRFVENRIRFKVLR